MSTIGLLLVGMLTLSGCAPESDSLTRDDSPNAEVAQKDETTTDVNGAADASAGRGVTPGDLPAELPIPDYDIANVVPNDMGGYVFYMPGTDIEADAETLRSMLLDAGFEQMAWGITEDHGANGIFIGETINVRMTVHEIGDGQIEIVYDYNPRLAD